MRALLETLHWSIEKNFPRAYYLKYKGMHEAHGRQWQGNAATTDYGTFHKRVILKKGTGNGNMELWLGIWMAFCLGEDELEH